ncbi:hypothetical protein RB653_008269 [Dictyostelium firmibasis]|uniref:Glycine cleavage system H protein n=1 Tax=Dictyostelium firmibasis TaxID=79012 RepID=A0AAN7TQS3_9MYCE
MLKTLRFGTRTFNQSLNTINRNFCTKYTKDHEWVNSLGSQKYRMGITDYAQRHLGDIVFVELPGNRKYEEGSPISTVESVKAVGEVFMPMEGSITKVNEIVTNEPELMNSEPMGDGWICEFESSKTDIFNSLMTEKEYEKYTENQ